ncbi:hypothetical protein RHGRI_012343 [Rhododendron griersonianum]|uniref:RING-type E3 ubiquitin transferase n=1 Tax=Rhododendron griersonianum TaxID=479676 RepID=A0AAV6KQ60_9ERIC|nr:hypothetical protein RHGRI_012343 [Rhododendron griersonianum]
MVDFVSPLQTPPIVSSASSSGAVIADDDLEDACSICLEPYNSDDPPTVTNCKHEYHLQCILEWSQRSKECPICWQLLVLKDPASQELLDAVEVERKLRSRRHARHTYEDNIINHDNSYAEDSDFDEHIMRHFAAAACRARYVNRRGRERSSSTDPSEFLISVQTEGLPQDVQHMHTSPEEHQSSRFEFSVGDSPNSGMLTGINAQRPPSMVQGNMNMNLNSVDDRDGLIKPRYVLELLFNIFNYVHLSVSIKKLICLPSLDTPDQRCLKALLILNSTICDLYKSLWYLEHAVYNVPLLLNDIDSSQMLPESPQRSSSTEFRAFSESIKSKFSSASARYKESFSKSTRGLKEKLLARNISVTELGKGVQREMNAGITGVARMFERLDVTTKRTGVPVPLSNSPGRTSNFSDKGKDMQESGITQSLNVISGETTDNRSSATPPHAHSDGATPGQLEVSVAQVC